MSIKRFHAPTMTQGLKLVAAELGNDAVILSNRRIAGGVEILAALESNVDQEADCPSTEERLNQADIALEAAQSNDQLITQENTQESADRSALSNWLETLKVKRSATPEAEPLPESAPEVEPKVVSAPAPIREADPSLAQVKAELEALKQMLSSQPAEPVARSASLTRSSVAPEVSGELNRMGFSGSFVKKMASAGSFQEAMQQLQVIMTPGNTQQYKQGCILFTGATGAGKTTTLAKIATQQVIEYGADKVAIISADHFRIGAQESLRTIAKILGVQFASATPERPLKAWLKHFSKKKLVLIDTSGCRDGMRFVREQMADIHTPIKQLLTVPASHQASVLSHQYQQSSKLIGAADGVVVTKLDENPVVGSVIEWLINQRLMIHAWADGSNIPDDLHWSKTAEVLLKAKKKIDRRSAHRAA